MFYLLIGDEREGNKARGEKICDTGNTLLRLPSGCLLWADIAVGENSEDVGVLFVASSVDSVLGGPEAEIGDSPAKLFDRKSNTIQSTNVRARRVT